MLIYFIKPTVSLFYIGKATPKLFFWLLHECLVKAQHGLYSWTEDVTIIVNRDVLTDLLCWKIGKIIFLVINNVGSQQVATQAKST